MVRSKSINNNLHANKHTYLSNILNKKANTRTLKKIKHKIEIAGKLTIIALNPNLTFALTP